MEAKYYEIVNDRYGNDSTPITLDELLAACRELWPDQDFGLHVVGREILDARGEVVGIEARPDAAPVEVEYCTNTEWLRVFGNLADMPGIEEGDENETADAVAAEAVRLCETNPALSGLRFVPAIGRRALCHGFNGAQYEDRVEFFGTFGRKFTDEETRAICDAVATAKKSNTPA
jgi:hypothetical protein